MEIWTLLPIGIVIATIATLLGIGGGIVWVPYLILVMDLEPKDAILLSFSIQVIGMGSGTLKYLWEGKIFWRLAGGLAIFVLAGVVGGAFLSQRVAGEGELKLIIGLFSMFIAIFFAFQSERYHVNYNTDKKTKAPGWLRLGGLGMGAVSGLLSIGIGDLLIPIIRGRLKVPMQNAIATALFLNFFVALSGGVSHALFSHELHKELLYYFAYGAAGVAIGGQLGGFLSTRADESRLKEMFIFLLMLIGIHMLYHAI